MSWETLTGVEIAGLGFILVVCLLGAARCYSYLYSMSFKTSIILVILGLVGGLGWAILETNGICLVESQDYFSKCYYKKLGG